MAPVKRAIHFKTRIGVLSYLPGMHYLEVPKKVVEELGGFSKTRVEVTVNKKITYRGGIVALGQGKGYISIKKKLSNDLGLREGSPASVTLKPDKSKYGKEMPEELEALLAQDDEGRKRFEGLTPGKQRYVIQYVSSVKNTDKRLDRAMLLIENLKRLPRGKENFREMMGLPARR